MADFWDFYAHYFTEDNPPVMADVNTGETIRHGGSSHRCYFWAGYDGLKGGIFPGVGGCLSAYRAGVAYRKAVNKGARPALPEHGNDHSRYRNK